MPRCSRFCTTRAAAPEIIGAAPDVPPKAVLPLPVPTSAETLAPGAEMSGLIAPSAIRGPQEELATMSSCRAMKSFGPMVAVWPSTVFRLFPSFWVMLSVGAVTAPPP